MGEKCNRKIEGDREVSGELKRQGYRKVRLGVDKGNRQSYSFWTKNNFRVAEEKDYIMMELELG